MKLNKTLVILVVFCIIVSAWVIGRNIQQNWSGIRIDFPSFYYAADLAFNDGSPYDKDQWKAVNAAKLPDQDLFPYLNLPFSLVLYYPMTLLSITAAQSILFVLNILMIYALIFFVFVKILGKYLGDTFTLLGAIFILCFEPVSMTIVYGQINLIVVVLICVFWYCTRENKYWLAAGASLGLAIILKIYPAIFLLFLFIKKQYKILLLVVGVILLFSLLAILLLPNDLWTDWYASVGSANYGGSFAQRIPSWKVGNQSINGVFTRIFKGVKNLGIPSLSDQFIELSPAQKRIFSRYAAFATAAVMILLWLLLAARRSTSLDEISRWDLEFSLLLVTMYLVAPISWYHHLVFIIPSIFILLCYALAKKSIFLFVGAGLPSLFLVSDYELYTQYFQSGFWSIFISAQFFAVLVLWVLHVLILWKSGSQAGKAMPGEKYRDSLMGG